MKQEPVAWRSFDAKWKRWYLYQVKPADNAEPLYTAPRELSDEEIMEASEPFWKCDAFNEVSFDDIGFARAILKKASEK
jgi:hypothetical protein